MGPFLPSHPSLRTISLRIVVTLAGLLLMAALSDTAVATTIIAPTIEEMAVEADAIVVGTVESVQTQQHDGRYHRTVTLEVSDVWKGLCEHSSECPAVIRIHALGGRGSDSATRVHGAENYAVGEQVLVFLQRRDESSAWRSHVLAWTKFQIENVGNALHAVRDIDELTAVRSESPGTFRKMNQPTVQFSLDSIRTRVEAALTSGSSE